jgi:hypothetical protein
MEVGVQCGAHFQLVKRQATRSLANREESNEATAGSFFTHNGNLAATA